MLKIIYKNCAEYIRMEDRLIPNKQNRLDAEIFGTMDQFQTLK